MTDGGGSIEDVAARLIMLRQTLGSGATQTAFAKASGLSQSEYNHFESARRPLNLQAANKLRRRWRVTLDWLYHGDRSGLSVEMSSSLPFLEDFQRERAG